jgi:hypothetical protein
MGLEALREGPLFHSRAVLSGRYLNATVPNVNHSGRMAHLSAEGKREEGSMNASLSLSVILVVSGGAFAAAAELKLPELKNS